MSVPAQVQALLTQINTIASACVDAEAQIRNGVADLRTREHDPKLDPTMTAAMLQEVRLRAAPFLTLIRDTAKILPDVS